MNISEALAVQTLLTRLPAGVAADIGVAHLELLADRSRKPLAAGISGQDVRAGLEAKHARGCLDWVKNPAPCPFCDGVVVVQCKECGREEPEGRSIREVPGVSTRNGRHFLCDQCDGRCA